MYTGPVPLQETLRRDRELGPTHKLPNLLAPQPPQAKAENTASLNHLSECAVTI